MDRTLVHSAAAAGNNLHKPCSPLDPLTSFVTLLVHILAI